MAMANMELAEKIKYYPTIAVRLICGASVTDAEIDKDAMRIEYEGRVDHIHVSDYGNIVTLAQRIIDGYMKPRGVNQVTTQLALDFRDLAEQMVLVDLNNNDSEFSVLFLLMNETGCGYYRGILPAQFMRGYHVRADFCQKFSYNLGLQYDVIVAQRQASGTVIETLRLLQLAGKKVVFETDDDFFSVPFSNPSSGHTNEFVQDGYERLMEFADAITVTNEVLKSRMGYTEKTYVLPNSVDFRPWLGEQGEKDNFRICWAGSASHAADFSDAYYAIDKVIRKRLVSNDVVFCFVGYLPEQFDMNAVVNRTLIRQKVYPNHVVKPEYKDRVFFFSGVDIHSYPLLMRELAPDVGLCPLGVNQFNQSKSEIKWVEYSSLGASVIASNVGPYARVGELLQDGISLCSTPEEWVDAIKKCAVDREAVRACGKRAKGFVLDNYCIEKNVHRWIDVYRKVLK